MHVEEDPGTVADEERGHDGHQQDAQVVLLHPAGAAPSLPEYTCTVCAVHKTGYNLTTSQIL